MSIFVTFMYGLMIPMLFPIALLNIVNVYLTEKIGLIWLYRRPPMLDIRLIRRAISLLIYAPIFMFAMGYWAVGSMQIFEGKTQEKVFNNRAGNPHHRILPNFSN